MTRENRTGRDSEGGARKSSLSPRATRRAAKPSTTGLHSISVVLDVISKLLLAVMGLGLALSGTASRGGTGLGIVLLVAALGGGVLSVLSLRYERRWIVGRLGIGGFTAVALVFMLISSFQPTFLGMLVVEALVLCACAHAYMVVRRRERQRSGVGTLDVETFDAD